MAKTRIEIQSQAEIDALRGAEEMAALNSEEGGELFRAIEEAKSVEGGATAMITRTLPIEKRGFMEKIPVAEFDMTLLRQRYGPGTYRIRFLGPRGLIPGGGTISVAPMEGPAATRATTNGAVTDFQTYLEFMQRQDEARREKNNRLLELGIPALGSIIAGLLNRPQGTDVATLITALKPAPGPSLADLSTAMMNLKQLTAPPASDKDPVDTVLKVFEAARELAEDKGGSAKGGSNWVDVIRDLIKEAPTVAVPLLQRLAQQRNGAGAAAATTNIAITAPPPITPAAVVPKISAAPIAAPAAPVSAGNAVPKSDNMLAFFRPMIQEKLKLISSWALADKEPRIYSELFLTEHIPRNLADYLPPEKALEYLQHEKWFAVVCEWEPSLAPFEKWCDRFRRELILWLSAPAEDEPESATDTPESEITTYDDST